MRKILIALLLINLLNLYCFASEIEIIFKQIELKLYPIINSLKPRAEIIYRKDTDSLIVGYRKHKFMIHGSSMTGEYSKKAFETDGPDYMGFILEIHIEPRGTIHQAVTPQTLQRPYWNTYLDVTLIKNTSEQFFWSLSYGSRTDKQLLENIKKVVFEFSK